MKKNNAVQPKQQMVISIGQFDYLPKSEALIVTDTSSITVDGDITPIIVKPKKEKGNPTDEEIKFVPWGKRNDTPNQVLKAITPSITLGSNVAFNADMIMGEGVKVFKRIKDESGEIKLVEQLPSEQQDVFSFLEDNDYNRLVQEWANDMATFDDAYAEFIFNDKNKVVSLAAKEVVYSRVSQMDAAGNIIWHGYSYKWVDGAKQVAVTRLLSDTAPLRDLKICRGLLPNEKGKTERENRYRYMMSLYLPTHGRLYYMNPAWWAIFSSGWYDIAQLIPKAKKALMTNKFRIAYMVYIRENFWRKLYDSKKATTEEQQDKARKVFLQNINDFLAGAENSGKSFFSEFSYDMQKGIEQKDIVITQLDKSVKEGGDWIEDNEEATNMMCYSMGIHPSLIGASPGKNKSINGTEARELFIIKQSMQRIKRLRLLLPLYMVKEINGWDKDLVFEIPNIMLTTLDKGTGAVKSIGNQQI